MRESFDVLKLRLMAVIFLVLVSDGVGLFFNKTSPMEILCDMFIVAFMVGGLRNVGSKTS